MAQVPAEVKQWIIAYHVKASADYDAHLINTSDPHGVTFAQITAVVGAKTSSYTATLTDNILLCDATNGNITITLPKTSTASGKLYYIKKTDSSDNDVIIDGYLEEKIDDETSQTFNTQRLCLGLVGDGTEWRIIMSYIPLGSVDQGGQRKVWVYDDNVKALLEHILDEFKKMNIHLQSITDEEIKEV